MMDVSITLVIPPTLIQYTDDIVSSAFNDVKNAVKASSTRILNQSQAIVPVDTGSLKSTGRVFYNGSNPYTAKIIYGGKKGVVKYVSYAYTVHEGTGSGANSMPRRFLYEPAIYDINFVLLPKIGDIFDKVI